MPTVLDEIVEDTRRRVAFERTIRPFPEVIEGSRIRPRRTGFPFIRNLEADGMSFICEVKRASPSKGMIAQDFPYLDIAREYEAAGAAAISVLTEPHYFKGRDEYLEEISDAVSTPLLRKDFVVDEYQVYRAKEIGASAVLLIASVLDDRQLEEYRVLAEQLGMNALVEAHTAEEVERAVSSGANIIGVNNRDLATFKVDLGNSIRLRSAIPDSVVAVSESGISSPADVRAVSDAGYDAVLVGEAFMRSPDKRALMESMSG
ncbi:MAG: indole-3-glycerol phosphate synthase TrpC [Thermoplasmata archaeon]|nr:indole-3-glycerol phosphate synthase TrpC [Thermoplasmata archaeon]